MHKSFGVKSTMLRKAKMHSFRRSFCLVFLLGPLVSAHTSCTHLNLLSKELTYGKRVQYTKDYLPINYTIKVQYEEVFREANVTRMSAEVEDEKIHWIRQKIQDDKPESWRKNVKPKALLDNCFRVMWHIFDLNSCKIYRSLKRKGNTV
ncbi:interleukin-34 [Latimeria chalumnae]|uniref:interleukin-34 n=1 Tax=Latimeria chalumnae TaxID=7897 RepID=UPI00313C5B28